MPSLRTRIPPYIANIQRSCRIKAPPRPRWLNRNVNSFQMLCQEIRTESIHNPGQTRTFLTPPSLPTILPAPPLQRLNAHRRLPYSSQAIYDIIADVPSYSSFLPYCISSDVTAWSAEDKSHGKKWPQEAVLEVGWGVVREKFRSRIFCAPGKAVEAVWGEGRCKLRDDEISHHQVQKSGREDPSPHANSKHGDGEGILTHLWTRWTVRPVLQHADTRDTSTEGAHLLAAEATGSHDENGTEVSLDIEFRFANPLYAAMSSAVAEGVADTMIEAFTRRVEQKLGHTSFRA